MTNAEIRQAEEQRIRSLRADLSTIKGLDPLIVRALAALDKVDFNAFRAAANKEVTENLNEWWLNPAKNSGIDEPLDAILFEYDHEMVNAAAAAYGIVDWDRPDKLTTGANQMGYDYDFAGDFEAVPGVTLSYLNPFVQITETHLPQAYRDDDVDVWDLDGFDDLKRLYHACGRAALQRVFAELNCASGLGRIHKADGFAFLIGEHDMDEVYPLWAAD